MKKFRVTQRFDAASATVRAAYAEEETWRSFADLPFVGDPVLVSFSPGNPIAIAMAYQVRVDLPPLAENFIDGDRLTFVERTELHSDGSGVFEIIPDHYAKLLRSSGSIELVEDGETACERHISGSVDIRLGWAGKLFESPVEDAIVNGLSTALRAQAKQVPLG